MFSEPKSSPTAYALRVVLAVTCVALGYWMRGGDVVNDARLQELLVISDKVSRLHSSVNVLVNSDQTYWRGYSEGIDACYKTHPSSL